MTTFLNFNKKKQLNQVVQLDVNSIVPNPHQPRTDFNEVEINILADSIRENGIIQPLSVRKIGDTFELIAGERRLRAAKVCGCNEVPCIVLDVNERCSAIFALVENIQREDLNFFEEASAIEKLIDLYGMTQEDAAIKLGKAQSTVANKLRLLRFSESERELIVQNNLTERHARALLKLATGEDRLSVLNKIIQHNLNVERTEQIINLYIEEKDRANSLRKRSPFFRDVRLFVNTINRAIETMQAAGIQANAKKIQNDEYIEYVVRIPVNK